MSQVEGGLQLLYLPHMLQQHPFPALNGHCCRVAESRTKAEGSHISGKRVVGYLPGWPVGSRCAAFCGRSHSGGGQWRV